MKRTLLRVLAVTLAVVLGGTMAFAAAVPADVKGLDCETAVTKLVEENIITGDTDGLYHPDKNLTRAEVSTLIAKAIDPKAAESQAVADFSDMAGYGWAAPFIGMMAEKGIAKGYPDGTFKPGANVKVSELAAFVIRACGVDEATLDGSWPDNYMKKADEMNLFDPAEGKDQTSGLDPNKPATKAQAAIAVYNALSQMRGDEQPGSDDWIFAKVSFSSDLTKLNDIPLAEDAKVYSYDKAKHYKADMAIPNVKKLDVQDPMRYKGVKTNGFYKTRNGEVTAVLLPADQGISGRIYSIVTGYYQTTDTSGNQVLGIETLTAGKAIDWLCKPEVTAAQIEAVMAGIPEGDIVELAASKGQILGLTTDQTQFGAKRFAEISAKDPANPAWTLVLEKVKNKDLFKLDSDPADPYMTYAADVKVYKLNRDGDGYDISDISAVKKNSYVRCFDITDDDVTEANIIFVKSN